jgi:hypothetical protein
MGAGGRRTFFGFPLGWSGDYQCQLEGWHCVPLYLCAEVLLDTTGETSEIGWLTYPPGGVSATLYSKPMTCPSLFPESVIQEENPG